MTTAPIRSLPAVRLLGRQPVSQGPVPCFYTASGIECLFTGSELALCLEAGFTLYEPWVSVELNGSWIARFPVQPGRSRVTLFRGMTPGVPKHVRVLKDVQAMHDDPDHFLLIEALAFEGAIFCPCPSRPAVWSSWATASPVGRGPSAQCVKRTGSPRSSARSTTMPG